MSENLYSGQACAKFILLGDHFVAHGSPAIAFPIRPLFCQTQIQHKSELASISSSMQAEICGIKAASGVNSKMKRTLKVALEGLGLQEDPKNWAILSQSNFSTSRGFGSSASFSCALLRALLAFNNGLGRITPSKEKVFEILQAMEKVFHNNPSGVDATAIWNEKPVFYKKNEAPHFISNGLVDFILVDSGERNGTAQLVTKVTEFRSRNLNLWEKYAHQMAQMARETETTLRSTGREALKSISGVVTEAHRILRELQLSNSIIEEMIEVATSLGVIAGKVSGAGTGGATVFLAPKGEGKKMAQKMNERKIPVLVLVEADE